jgi:cobalt transporter subunit CbtA
VFPSFFDEESNMFFRRIFLCALLAGLCAGLAYSAIQRLQVVPTIAAAEVFESAAASKEQTDHHESTMPAHVHEAAAWEPAEGTERTFWTVIANVLGATGFALLLIPALGWWDHQRGGTAASLRSGLIWGAAGWLSFFAWPAIGMRPELPGEVAAALQARQIWWLLAVVCAIAGLAALAFAKGKWRLLALPLFMLPFVAGAPHVEGSPFGNFPADATAKMLVLKSRFVVATAIASAVQWLVLGGVSGVIVARWLRPLMGSAPDAGVTRTATQPLS